MKLRFTLLSAFIVFCFTVKAQTQLQNANFESWTNVTTPNVPDDFAGWESINPAIPNHFTFKDTSSVKPGSFSVQIRTDTATIIGSPQPLLLEGILSAGGSASLSTANGYVPSSVSFTGRPDTISFDLKYSSPGIDSPTVFLALGRNDTAILQVGYTIIVKDTTWGTLTVPITSIYTSQANPTALILEFTSSGKKPVLGSKLNIDNIRFGYNPDAAVKNIKNEIGLKVYPNPATSILNISADKDLAGNNVQIFNMNGQLVSNKMLEGNANTVDLSGFSSGTYIYKITDKQNNVIDENKVSVIK